MSASGEHVVLANCVDGSGILSSEMAYYTSAPNGSPSDFALVSLPSNKTAAWTCSTTTAVYITTHTTFVATIGPNVTEGGYAGIGSNGYDSNNGGFRCWQKSMANLYAYQGRTCSGIYDCDHESAPSSTTVASCTATATSSSSSTASAIATTGPNTGLSTGAIIGIAVGAAVAGFFGVIAGVLICWHLRSKRRAAANAQRQPAGTGRGTLDSSGAGLLGMFKKSPVSNNALAVGVPRGQPANAVWQGQGPPPIHELEEQWRPLEAPNISRSGELDGRPLAELATPESQFYAFYRPGAAGESPISEHPNRQSMFSSNVP